jgi:hypothetical protein
MIKSFSLAVATAYIMSVSVASGQGIDSTHVHDHHHHHGADHSRSADHDHSHDHNRIHSHDHDHEHVHNHGAKHTHDEITISVLGTQAYHNASFNSLPPIENCCTGFTNSTGLGFGAEIGYTTPLSSDGLTITPHVAYRHMPVSFESYSTEKAFTGGVVSGDALFRHTLDVAWSALTFGARLEYPVLQGVHLGVGLDGMFFASGSYNQTETLEEPTNLVFETGTRVRLDRNGYIRGQNDVVFNATGSLRIRVLEKRQGSAGIDLFGRYSLPLQPLFNAQTWRGNYGNPPATFYIDSYYVNMLTFGVGFAL